MIAMRIDFKLIDGLVVLIICAVLPAGLFENQYINWHNFK
jgi:hypothetical protein